MNAPAANSGASSSSSASSARPHVAISQAQANTSAVAATTILDLAGYMENLVQDAVPSVISEADAEAKLGKIQGAKRKLRSKVLSGDPVAMGAAQAAALALGPCPSTPKKVSVWNDIVDDAGCEVMQW